jgi:hypothetical protein
VIVRIPGAGSARFLASAACRLNSVTLSIMSACIVNFSEAIYLDMAALACLTSEDHGVFFKPRGEGAIQ